MPSLNYSVFKTGLGWCGVIGNPEGKVKRIIPPAKRKNTVTRWLLKGFPDALKSSTRAERGIPNQCRMAVGTIKNYLTGKGKRFDFPIDLAGFTEFEKKVYRALMRIPSGRITTYGRIARAIGKPRASRAVGNALAKNPLPLVIPCHRVIRSDGSLGNFSALGGTALKKRLLQMEGFNNVV